MTLKRHPVKTFFIDNSKFFGLCLICILLTGCSSNVRKIPDQVQAEINTMPAELRELYKLQFIEGERNFVLNNMHIGVAAFEKGDFELAKRAFEDAILNIEYVYSDTEASAKARSLWHAEGAKTFKGEPYERASIYYYLGLIDLIQGDYENARASFKSGVLQDAFAEEDQHQCDFALLIFLQGWASQLMGDEAFAIEAFKEVKKLRPDFQFPDLSHNTLLIAETGRSPRKLADGVGHSELVYRRGKAFKENRVKFRINNLQTVAYPMEDIYFQSASRGGRAVDKILKGKAVFREKSSHIGLTLSNIANKAILISPLLGSAGGVASMASGGVAVLGAVATFAAIHSNPHADVRYWKNLSDTVHIHTFQSDTANLAVSAEYFDRKGRGYPSLTSAKTQIKSDNGSFFWFRSRSSFNVKNKWHNIFISNK